MLNATYPPAFRPPPPTPPPPPHTHTHPRKRQTFMMQNISDVIFQIVITNRKKIVLVQSGFLGHENDATTYHHSPSIGPGLELNFPRNTRLLADSIYPCRYPLITPYKIHQYEIRACMNRGNVGQSILK